MTCCRLLTAVGGYLLLLAIVVGCCRLLARPASIINALILVVTTSLPQPISGPVIRKNIIDNKTCEKTTTVLTFKRRCHPTVVTLNLRIL